MHVSASADGGVACVSPEFAKTVASRCPGCCPLWVRNDSDGFSSIGFWRSWRLGVLGLSRMVCSSLLPLRLTPSVHQLVCSVLLRFAAHGPGLNWGMLSPPRCSKGRLHRQHVRADVFALLIPPVTSGFRRGCCEGSRSAALPHSHMVVGIVYHFAPRPTINTLRAARPTCPQPNRGALLRHVTSASRGGSPELSATSRDLRSYPRLTTPSPCFAAGCWFLLP